MGYFDQFPFFDHDPGALLKEEFDRLACAMNWNSRERRLQWDWCLRKEFQIHYGSEAKLDNWQRLCIDVGITPQPTMAKCKKELKLVNVNICHLIDARRTGRFPVRKFESYKALKQYTRQNNLFFPKKQAKKDGFISILLKRFF
ncbi:MAG: hypothetical protein M1834_008282 [Cirrosporium novae-zelandiae]|nr:MAG: hypothetical protein M1834_008282 [Cirrosporium novae-zelandiae]